MYVFRSSRVFLLVLVALLTSCETDIDVNAESEDIPVVYAAIDPSETVHYVKINKAFLGETSALDLAADAANFTYDDGEISATVEAYDLNELKNTYSLSRTVNEIVKEQGIFDNSTNVLYKFTEPNINRDYTYKLRIVNPSLAKEVNAETEIVNQITITEPVNPATKFQFWSGDPPSAPIAGNPLARTIGIRTAEDIGRVAASVVFNYVEFYTLASGKDSVIKSIEIPLGEEITSTATGGETLEWELKGETFFEKIGANVPTPASVGPTFSHRRLKNITLEFSIAGTELNTFMKVNAPSNNVNQERPNYTNINNGVGVFSSREKRTWNGSHDEINQVNIQNTTIRYLEFMDLGFCFGTTAGAEAPCTQL